MMQYVGCAGKKEAKVIGQKTLIGRAITGQVVFYHFDKVLILPAGTINILLEDIGRCGIQ